MRFGCVLVSTALFLCASPSQSKATTFNLPLNGLVGIIGDIPEPISVTFEVTANTILPIPPPPYVGFVTGFPAWEFGIQLFQANQFGGFSLPQACAGTSCGTLLEFAGCGASLGCGFDPLPVGTLIVRNGFPVSILVSDSTRLFGLITSEFNNIPFDLQITADVPDGLRVGIIDARFDASEATATPLPAALPLFATGLGALGLLGWRRKRKTAAIVA
jgi:hypothetical protein